MKKSNLVLIVLLVVLVVGGWFVQVKNGISETLSFNKYVRMAEEYSEKGLFQKAIDSFASALDIKENLKTRMQWLKAYEDAYKDGVVSSSKLAGAITELCELDPSDPAGWEKLMQLYVDLGDYNKAHNVVGKLEKYGVSSDQLATLRDKVEYQVRSTGKGYKEIRIGDDGSYALKDSNGWSLMNAKGKAILKGDYTYVSPTDKNGIYLRHGEEGVRIFNKSGVVQAILDISFVCTGAYGDGLLPVCIQENQWRYYDCEKGEFILDTYEQASNFTGGIAAVCKNGKWTLITKDGKQVCDTTFDDVKLHDSGSYVKSDVMIASVGGKYGIYDAKGEAKCKFTAVDMDVYMGSYIAFKDDSGKWGYADAKGKVKIEPQFQEAMSFSGGLGAVCKDNLWGFAKNSGKVVVDYQYLAGGYFNKEGFCFVELDENWYKRLELRY